ncbi:MAG: Rpn family recombination-promoting nuclease/putative transposase, partial [Nannocystaceae bacterium]
MEHRSTPDPTMPRRHHQYTAAIWQRHAREFPADTHITPIVIPVVLYQG